MITLKRLLIEAYAPQSSLHERERAILTLQTGIKQQYAGYVTNSGSTINQMEAS